jgi:hypothetical protein
MKKLHIVTGAVLALAISAHGYGQGSQLPKYTVATLPAASSQITYTVQVIDGTTAIDCTVGGAVGTARHNVLCVAAYNGSAWIWVPVSTGGASGPLTIQHNGTDVPTQNPLNFLDAAPSLPAGYTSVTFSPDGAGGLGAYVPPINTSSILQMENTPPASGTWIKIYPTSVTSSGGGNFSASGDLTSGWVSGSGCTLGGCVGGSATVAWTFTLPSYLHPANIGQVWASTTSSVSPQGNNNGYAEQGALTCGKAGGGDWVLTSIYAYSPLPLLQRNVFMNDTAGSDINTVTCSATVVSGSVVEAGVFANIASIYLQVQDSVDTAPADTNINVRKPLNYNSSLNLLSLYLPPDIETDYGLANGYIVADPSLTMTPGTSFKFIPLHNNTVTTPTMQINSVPAATIVGPTGGALVANDIATTAVAEVVLGPDSKWWLQNPQVSGGGGVVYPPAGVPNSTGSAWGTSYTVGTSANNLIQLNASAQIPAVSGALLTNLPFMSLTTLGTSGPATLSGGILNIPQYTGGGGGGLTSINSQTGPGITIHSSDSSVNVNTTTNDIDLTTAGGGGGNPSTTAYIVGSVSSPYDDSDANSRIIGVPSSVNCVHTTTSTCTVVFPSAHGVAVGGAIETELLSGWPAGPAGLQQGANFGSFQVTTVPNSTTLTFTTPTVLTYSCGPCSGNVADASYWAIWEFARQPNIYGHGTVYGFITTTAGMDTNFTTYTSGITGSPIFYIDDSGQNDFAGGASVAAVEASHQSVWAKAHAAGMKVVQSTMTPAQYGLSGVGIKHGQINYWYYLQRCTAALTTSGQCLDLYGDVAQAQLKAGDMATMPNQQPNQLFASVLNQVFSARGSIDNGPPLLFSFSNSGLGNDYPAQIDKTARGFYDPAWNNWMNWNHNANGFNGIDIYMNTANNTNNLRLWYPSLSAGAATWYADCFGRDNSTNNGFCRGFHYTGAGSSSNYAEITPFGGTAAMRWLANGGVQTPALVAASGTKPVLADTSGNLSISGLDQMQPGGDLSGTQTSQQVNKLIGVPFCTGYTPTSGQIISYTTASSPNPCYTAIPAPSGTFTAGGDLAGTSTSQQVKGINSVPLCTGFSPTNGNIIVYTTGGTPNPCYASQAAPSGSFSAGGDLAGSSSSQQVKGINSVPLCTGFSPTNGQNLQYTTASSPNPCYTAAASSSAWTNITSSVTASGCTPSSGSCVVGTPSAAITFSSIPAGHNHFAVTCMGRVSDSAANESIDVQFNSDTGSNYARGYFGAQSGATVAGQGAAQASIQTGVMPGGTAPANYAGALKLWVYNYANTSFFKATTADLMAFQATSALNAYDVGGQWLSTSAITSVSLKDDGGGNWIAGSACSIYAVD